MLGSVMTDWKAMARALGLQIPEAELDRTLAPLAPLEAAFARAGAHLDSSVEPSVVFSPSTEEDTE